MAKSASRQQRYRTLRTIQRVPLAHAFAGRSIHANDQSTGTEGPDASRVEKQSAGAPAEPAETRRVHTRVYDDAQEAQFRAAEGCEGAAHQRLRGHQLYRRR